MGSSCWIYARAITPAGYGVIWIEGKLEYAHRLMFEITKERIPKGLELDHLCRVTQCINPDHLEPVTHKENVMRGSAVDKFIRHNAHKTHCPKGHEYNEENTYYRTDREGHRECRRCRKEASHRFILQKTT